MNPDAIIIGSGQAANPLAVGLANHGWKVVLIERAELGGTCVNTGCTPTKTLVHRAQVAYYVRNSAKWGVHSGALKIDYPAIKAQKDEVVCEWRDGVRESLEDEPNVTVMHGSARFTGPGEISVNRQSLRSDKIFINTGGEPAIPSIPGLQGVSYLTNESILELTEVPEALLVLGGGYIGLEFAQMFQRLGSKVTVVHNGDRILPREDPDVSEAIRQVLADEGVEFRFNAQTTHASGSVELSFADGSSLAGSHLLVAVGRRPRSADLDLQKAGIDVRSDGSIVVNDKLETTAPGVWALGDVKGGPAFTHISYNDYQVVYGNLIEGKDLSIKDRIVPYAVYTDPEVGAVGITVGEARKLGKKLKIGKIPMSSVARAVENDESAGLMKLVIDAETDQILGARIVCSGGGEIVHALYMLMLAKAPYTLLEQAIYIHPTLTEGFFRLVESVAPAS